MTVKFSGGSLQGRCFQVVISPSALSSGPVGNRGMGVAFPTSLS
jgi:hypothetical protein